MRYDEFENELLKSLERIAQKYEYEMKHQAVNKVNLHELEAVTFYKKDVNMSPTIYVEDMYKRFENGASLSEIVNGLEALIRDNATNPKDLNITKEIVMDNCTPQLIGVEGNEAMLNELPHRIVGDNMAMIVRVNVGQDASFVVRDGLLEHFMIGKNELMNRAVENLESSPYELKSLNEMMTGIIGMPESAPEPNEEVPNIMVLTNKQSFYGAAEILNRKAMEEATQKMHVDDNGFFIIPSSLHETLLVPFGKNDDVDELKNMLKEMVKSVNDTTVDKADLLSYSVYFYNPQKQIIENADTCVMQLTEASARMQYTHHM